MPRAYKALPPASELWELFDYKPLTGELVRKSTGKVTGTLKPHKYVVCGIGKSTFYCHRIIYSWVNGSIDLKDIDHIDRNKQNNRFWNLRQVTISQNNANRIFKGVSYVGPRWRARISMGNRKIRHLGMFETEAEARAAYEKASRDLRGEFSPIR